MTDLCDELVTEFKNLSYTDNQELQAFINQDIPDDKKLINSGNIYTFLDILNALINNDQIRNDMPQYFKDAITPEFIEACLCIYNEGDSDGQYPDITIFTKSLKIMMEVENRNSVDNTILHLIAYVLNVYIGDNINPSFDEDDQMETE